jgi:CMP-N-acetylneuraminic acid synthetase
MAINGHPAIALIPARAGSKGVPGKNSRIVAGKPLIQYTMEAALETRGMDAVYVSSDDAAILALAKAAGATPLQRPIHYATDSATAMDVVDHFISSLADELRCRDPYLVYLQPTSPLRGTRHIQEAIALLDRMQRHTLVSVVELEKSPYKSFLLSSDGLLQSLFDERLSNARRQDLPRTFIPNGAIYIFRISDYHNRGGFPSNDSIPYIMSRKDSLDIDSEEDIQRLESILENRHG